MTNLARRFLSEEAQEKVRNAVKEEEKKTSGEIVPMVVSASYPYPMADIIGGAAISLPVALLITPLVGRWFWIGPQNMWLFLGLLIPLFFLFHEVVRRTVFLKRIFVSPSQMEEEVEEAAMASFFKQGLYRTREGTGVLIFISVFERKVCVLADRGIDQKVEKGKWNEVVQTIVSGVKEKRQADAICEAVRHAGDLLKTHFPARADDKDELTDLVI